jgi:uncharacterized protein
MRHTTIHWQMENDNTESTEHSIEAENQHPTALPNTEVKAGNTMGMLCHLLSLTQLLGVPLGNILGPLVIWLLKKEADPFADTCGKESLNFQISMTIYMIISGILVLLFIGIFMVIALMIFNITYTIIAAIKASEGTSYTYPFTIRFIK